MTTRETLQRLRDVMARELETISMYEQYAETETDPEMKTLFQHLADEEKEHVTEIYEAVLVRDAAQKKWAESGTHVLALRESRFGAQAASSPPTLAVRPVTGTPVAGIKRTPGLRPTPPTVGSLLGQRQGGSV